jgi:hypothetical protein
MKGLYIRRYIWKKPEPTISWGASQLIEKSFNGPALFYTNTRAFSAKKVKKKGWQGKLLLYQLDLRMR